MLLILVKLCIYILRKQVLKKKLRLLIAGSSVLNSMSMHVSYIYLNISIGSFLTDSRDSAFGFPPEDQNIDKPIPSEAFFESKIYY